MDVDWIKLWDIQDSLRQDLAVSCHHKKIRIQTGQYFNRFGRGKFFRLVNVKAQLKGGLFDRGLGHGFSPAFWTVRLGDHKADVKVFAGTQFF